MLKNLFSNKNVDPFENHDVNVLLTGNFRDDVQKEIMNCLVEMLPDQVNFKQVVDAFKVLKANHCCSHMLLNTEQGRKSVNYLKQNEVKKTHYLNNPKELFDFIKEEPFKSFILDEF